MTLLATVRGALLWWLPARPGETPGHVEPDDAPAVDPDSSFASATCIATPRIQASVHTAASTRPAWATWPAGEHKPIPAPPARRCPCGKPMPFGIAHYPTECHR